MIDPHNSGFEDRAMKLTVEPTEEFFRTDEGVPVRAWKGQTDAGTPVIAFIAAIAAPDGVDQADLARELREIPGPNIGHVAIHGEPCR